MKKMMSLAIFMGVSIGLTACSEQVDDGVVVSVDTEGTIVQSEEKEEIVADYGGSLWLKEQEYHYLATREDGTLDYDIYIQNMDEETVQEISYSYDLQGDTAVLAGIEPKDVNQDGYEDILILLGGHGNVGALWACYVYDADAGQYVYVEGFEELPGAEIDEEIRSCYYEGGGSFYRLERYIIENNELVLEGRLTQKLREQDFGPYISCDEEHYEDGKLVYVKKDIQVTEIDMDFWKQDIGQGLELEVSVIPSEEQDNPYKEILDIYYQLLYERQTASGQYIEIPDEYDMTISVFNPYWSWEGAENILSKEGYTFADLNADGVEELLIGWVGNEFWNMDEGYVFAVYTLVDGEAVLAIEGWERCLYVIGEDGYLYQSGSYSAWENYYTKGKFNPEFAGYLEPVEELYSHMGTTEEQEWKYIQNASESEAVPMEGDAALELGEGWLDTGKKLEYTLFSEYRQVEDSNIH